jgi:DNA helicase-2/ATP-dependent DNA helicase PcrA
LTNKVIEYAKEKYSKVLFTNREGNQKPVYIETQSENYQSKFIVQRVLELREEGIPLDNIAVLFRAGWHSNDLEIELASHNIPFIKYGGFKFIETAHVKDVIAHLRIVFNPLDSVSWHRVLLLIEGIGPKTANNIIFEIVDNKKGLEGLKENRFSNKKCWGDLNKLFSIIDLISAKDTFPAKQIILLLEYYRPLLENKYDDFNKRLNDLDSLIRIAERYNNLEQFLVDITLEPLETSQGDAVVSDKEEEKLVLSTIHSAKGLEWHTVFIIFLVDGYLPSSYSLDSEENVEEERRLLYVATTRAKENLYLIKPEIEYTGWSYFNQSFSGFSKVSRFLDERDIMEKYIEKWVLADEEKEEIDKQVVI